jgi:hypothetical protein
MVKISYRDRITVTPLLPTCASLRRERVVWMIVRKGRAIMFFPSRV